MRRSIGLMSGGHLVTTTTLARFCLQRLAQHSDRKERIFSYERVIVNQQDGDIGCHISMLESIIEDEHIWHRLHIVHHVHNATATVGIDCHSHLWKFVLHLIRLVANFGRCRLAGGQQIAMCLAFEPSAEHRHHAIGHQQTHQILGKGVLPFRPW